MIAVVDLSSLYEEGAFHGFKEKSTWSAECKKPKKKKIGRSESGQTIEACRRNQ